MSYLEEYNESKKCRDLVLKIYFKAPHKDLTDFNTWLEASPLNSSYESLNDVSNIMDMSKTKFKAYLRKVMQEIRSTDISTLEQYNFIVSFLDRCLVARVLVEDYENAYYLRKHLYNLAINNFDFETYLGPSYN